MNDPIVLATSNHGKLRELAALLPADQRLVPQTELGIPDALEDGLSFVENALIKARNACSHSGFAAIADDSGLEVEALRGRPGIYSARYAGPSASDADNVAKLLDELEDFHDPERRARFVCALVYMTHANDPVPLICVGTWSGSILRQPRGDQGFGYDPVFKPVGMSRSAAELDAAQKNSMSHRAEALRCLSKYLASETHG